MSLLRYREYKYSGVEWIGDVPSHWNIGPLKRLFKIVGGSTPKSDEESFWDGDVIWVSPADLSRQSSMYISDSIRKISQAGLRSCGTTLVPQGSIILSTRAPIGSLAIADKSLCTNQGCKSLVPDGASSPLYFTYTLLSATKPLNLRGKGTTFLELSADELSAFPVPHPPREEQEAIAAFLDRETAKIDTLITEQEKLLTLLAEKRQATISHAVTKGLNPDVPMKNSGVEWLGEVPAHWSLPPLYLRYSIELGKMLDSSRITGTNLVPYLRNIDVQWDDINTSDLPEMDVTPDEYQRYTVRAGDLLVCEGGEVGRAAVVSNIQGTVAYQKALHRLRTRSSDEHPRFMFYTFACATKAGAFAGEGQSTIAHLTGEQLRKYRFPKPPKSEQEAISSFLDKELAQSEKLELAATHAVALLKERRSALISAAVTGQIDVRNAAPSEKEMSS